MVKLGKKMRKIVIYILTCKLTFNPSPVTGADKMASTLFRREGGYSLYLTHALHNKICSLSCVNGVYEEGEMTSSYHYYSRPPGRSANKNESLGDVMYTDRNANELSHAIAFTSHASLPGRGGPRQKISDVCMKTSWLNDITLDYFYRARPTCLTLYCIWSTSRTWLNWNTINAKVYVITGSQLCTICQNSLM